LARHGADLPAHTGQTVDHVTPNMARRAHDHRHTMIFG
jgi:hypothetical protein